jgi:hypothetical protein
MLNIDVIPDYMRHALALVQQHDPSAFIGGGALRDLALGVFPKDVDIFCGPGFDVDAFGEANSQLLMLDQTRHTLEYEEMFSDLRAVYEFRLMDGPGGLFEHPPIQLIVMSRVWPIEEQLARFDFGACRAAFDGTAIQTHAAFGPDIAARTLTYMHTPEHPGYRHSMERAARLSRWHGLRVVMPGYISTTIEEAEPTWEVTF